MLIAPHFLTGAAVATAVPEPLLAIPLALLSHFVLDLLPHRDLVGERHLAPENLVLRLIDGLTALFLFFLFVPAAAKAYAFLIGAVALLPDLLVLPKIFWPELRLSWLDAFQRFHFDLLQKSVVARTDWFLGLLTQLVVVALALLVIA